MRIEHPIYGKGIVLSVARGVFSFVKFDTGQMLAVSLNVCWRAQP